jgi:hypothetical protein
MPHPEQDADLIFRSVFLAGTLLVAMIMFIASLILE